MNEQKNDLGFTDKEVINFRRISFVVMIFAVIIALVFLYRIIKYQETVLKDPCQLCMELGYECFQTNFGP